MVSASGVVLQAGSLPTRRSTIANPTRPTQSVNRQRAVPKDVAPIIKNIRIIYIHTYVQAYTQTCPCTSTHLFAYVLICPSPANPPTSVCSYVHTRATSNAGLRRRNCASTFVSGTLAGPDHNLESSLDDLREAARLMPTSAVPVFWKPAVSPKQASQLKMTGTEIRSCLHKCKELLHGAGHSATLTRSLTMLVDAKCSLVALG